MKFNSQICTTREQSERLLALGLKKETADMCYQISYLDCGLLKECSPSLIPHNIIDGDRFIPAWSLHRLIKLAYGNWDENIVPIYLGNSYDMLIGRIEFQIKQGVFGMKRREEIEKAANEFYKGDEVSTFVVAAQWADKTMLNKVCDWIQCMVLDYMQGDITDVKWGSMLADFRKDMED